jgi:Fe2+ transport system protein FeoA
VEAFRPRKIHDALIDPADGAVTFKVSIEKDSHLSMPTHALPVLDPLQPVRGADARQSTELRACCLAACRAGSRATVVDLACDDVDACRLRALGLNEGTTVSVVDARHGTLLDVRGTRLALGAALTERITVQPHA